MVLEWVYKNCELEADSSGPLDLIWIMTLGSPTFFTRSPDLS